MANTIRVSIFLMILSVLALLIFFVLIRFYPPLARTTEHAVIEAAIGQRETLLYQWTDAPPSWLGSREMQVFSNDQTEGEFATWGCLLAANAESIKLNANLLNIATIKLHSYEWTTDSYESSTINWSQYSSGSQEISRPCFNRTRTRAVVYIGFLCGKNGCSGGTVHLLAQENGVWKIIDGMRVWVS